MALWRAERPLVLASKSAARRTLLEAAGIPVEIHPADIDERAVECNAKPGDAAGAAALLAAAKALAVSASLPGRLVLGADQVLALHGRRFGKPADRATARNQLAELRGKGHALHSAAVVARDGEVLFAAAAEAHLTMRSFSDAFVENYLDAAGDAVLASVGAYQVEGLGVHLFANIAGEHATILGLPLLPLLAFLRREGCLAE